MRRCEQKIRLPREYDRRIKLSDAQRDDIRQRFKAGEAMRAIARDYSGVCSRSTVVHVCRPERLAHVRQARKERAKDGRYYPGAKKWAETQREHRRYKTKVFKLLRARGELKTDSQK